MWRGLKESFITAPRGAKIMLITGVTIASIFVSLSLLGEIVAPYPADLRFPDSILSPPSANHIMGTDILGRDILSRLIVGSRISISVSFLAVLISLASGTILGSISGFTGGKVDRVLLLFIDALYSFPYYVLLLLVAVTLGPGVVNTALAIATTFTTQYFRIVRSITLSVKERTFIEAERVLGASKWYILLVHIAPSYVSTLIVLTSLTAAKAIVAVAGLGFLGLGIQPPIAEWGTDMAQGRTFVSLGMWWPTFFPGLFIFLMTIGLNFTGEGLDKILRTRKETKKIL